MTKDQIYRLALASGFKAKEQPDGTMDLHPYVYDFANRLLSQHDTMGLDLIAQIRIAAGDPEGKLMQDQLVEHITELKAKAENYRPPQVKPDDMQPGKMYLAHYIRGDVRPVWLDEDGIDDLAEWDDAYSFEDLKNARGKLYGPVVIE